MERGPRALPVAQNHRLHGYLPDSADSDDMRQRHNGLHVDRHTERHPAEIPLPAVQHPPRPGVAPAGVALLRRCLHDDSQRQGKARQRPDGRSACRDRVHHPAMALRQRPGLRHALQRDLRLLRLPAAAADMDAARMAHNPLRGRPLLLVAEHRPVRLLRQNQPHLRRLPPGN